MTATLSAVSLLSKYGFSDGDVLDDLWWDHHDEYLPGQGAHHKLLYRLVTERLVPLIEAAGHAVEVEFIETFHNPVRAYTLDRTPISYPCGSDTQNETLDKIPPVSVTIEDLERLVREL